MTELNIRKILNEVFSIVGLDKERKEKSLKEFLVNCEKGSLVKIYNCLSIDEKKRFKELIEKEEYELFLKNILIRISLLKFLQSFFGSI